MSRVLMMLAQIGGRTTSPAYSSQSWAAGLPKPHGPVQTVGLAILGVLLIAAILGAVIWLSQRDE